MIFSFADKDPERIWQGLRVRRFSPQIADRALAKLRLLDAATSVEDLRLPPGNRLEQLRGERSGQHSIQINDQWRVCFRWIDGNAQDVEIADYH
jgi:proteic killer suppression protein